MAYADLDTVSIPTAGQVAPAAWGIQIRDNWRALANAWTTYTPTWTASTTNPVIGNGTLTGKYISLNKLLILRVTIIAGSSTTFGSGTYAVSLPSGLTTPNDGQRQIIECFFEDTGVSWYRGIARIQPNATTLALHFTDNSVQANPNTPNPATWSTGDAVTIQGVLEVA